MTMFSTFYIQMFNRSLNKYFEKKKKANIFKQQSSLDWKVIFLLEL